MVSVMNGSVGLAVAMSVGAVMVRVGLGRGLLMPRKARRRCPSCGRLLERSVCGRCAGGG